MDQKTAAELLCYCLSMETGTIRTGKLKQLSVSDWEHIIRQSIRHGVAPLLYQRLKTHSSGTSIPADITQQLREMYLRSAADSMRRYHQLSKVLTLLQNEGIPVIVLKGAHLAQVVYGNPALRPMADVDLLFRKEDLARGQQRLLKAGYLSHDRLFLDIHWNIDLSIAGLNIDMDEVWKRSQSAVIAGVNVMVLSPEDLLVHLCVHLAFHHLFQFAGLRALCDIRETIKYYFTQMEWKQICHRAREWGVCNSVYLTLLLARDIISAPVPGDVIKALKPGEDEPQVKIWAMEQIFQKTTAELPLSPYFWQLWKPGSFREKIVSFRKLLLPAPEFVSQKYPASFGSIRNYLYYLVRLKNHFIPYTRVLWRILNHDKEMTALIKRQHQNIAMREWFSSR